MDQPRLETIPLDSSPKKTLEEEANVFEDAKKYERSQKSSDDNYMLPGTKAKLVKASGKQVQMLKST